VLEGLTSQGRYLTRLAVRDGAHIRVLDASQVDWFAVQNERTFAYVGNSAYRVRRTLAELEARLDPARFFRAHRGVIVNLDRVAEIVPWFRGSHKLRLTTGAEVELSRAQARALRRILRW
jgi:two-component system LytT family response regulator